MGAEKWLMVAIQASVFLTVVAVGLRARFRDVTALMRRPDAFGRALLAMYVVMPALAVLLALALDLRPVVKVVLVAVALSPVPPMLPKKALRAGGGPSYTVGLLAVAAALALVVVPSGIWVIDVLFARTARVDIPRLAMTILVSVLLPLLVGMLLRWRFPRVAARAAHPVSTLATVMLAAGAIALFASSWHLFPSLIGERTILAIVIFVVIGLAAGHFIGGPGADERTVLALAAATRHPGVAITLGVTNFADRSLVVATVLLYLLVATLAAIPYLFSRKRREPAPRRAWQH
jgi:BASS family bile acid:Na+ symporter